MRLKAGAGLFLGFLFLWGVAPAKGQTQEIVYCYLYSGADSLTLGDPRQKPDPQKVFTAVVRKGEDPLAYVSCRIMQQENQYFVYQLFGIPRGQVVSLEFSYEIPGARKAVGGHGREGWFLPLRPGANQITVVVKHSPYKVRTPDPKTITYQQRPGGQTTRSFSFTAWVFTTEPWGALEPVFADPLYENALMDASGNLYLVAKNHVGGGKYNYAFTRHAPGGKISGRYEIGSASDIKPLGVDTSGNVYALISHNIARFGPSGKFEQTIATAGQTRPARSSEELGKYLGTAEKPSGPLAEFSVWSPYHRQPPVTGGRFYIMASKQEGKPPRTAIYLGSLGTDGSFTRRGLLASEGGKFSYVSSLVSGPGGSLYALASGGQSKNESLLVLNNQGGLVREVRKTPGRRFISGLAGVDAQGGVYGSACERMTLEDQLVSANLTARSRELVSPKTLLIETTDLLTGQILKDKNGVWPRTCWVHGGAVYVLYRDFRVARITSFGAASLPQERVGPPPAGKSARLKLARVGPSFEEGVLFDGNTPLEFTATLTDQQGNPLPGVPVELRVAEDWLPRRGRFSLVSGSQSDANGQVRGRYIPPLLEEKEADTKRPPVIALYTRAKPEGMPETETQVMIRPIVPAGAVVRVSRVGFATVESIPVKVASLKAGTLKGIVAFRPQAGRTAGAATASGFPYSGPILGAKVELLASGKKAIGEAVSGPDGSFTLVYAPDRTAKQKLETVLPKELIVSDLDPEVLRRIKQFQETLRLMNGSTYNYQTARLSALLSEAFPKRLMDAETPERADRTIDQLNRVSLLTAAIKVTHDLEVHAAERWADSMSEVMKGMIGLLDPLEKLNKSRQGASATGYGLQRGYEKLAGERGSAGDALKLSYFGKLRWVILNKIEAKLKEKKTEDKAWNLVKDKISKYILEPLAAGDHWQNSASRGLVNAYRERAQEMLNQAAQAWEAGSIAYGGPFEKILRHRYGELAENRDRVTNRQLDKDLTKADVDFAFDWLGKSAVILSGLYGSPAAAQKVDEGVEALKKGTDALNTAMDAHMGYLWLQDYMKGYGMLEQYARITLQQRTLVCIGEGC